MERGGVVRQMVGQFRKLGFSVVVESGRSSLALALTRKTPALAPSPPARRVSQPAARCVAGAGAGEAAGFKDDAYTEVRTATRTADVRTAERAPDCLTN